jgi:cytochrome P450
VGVDPGSFLGLMLSARSRETGEQLGDKTVVAQSNTFILAGYETTANTLAFCIYNIAAHPEVQQRVLEEIDSYGRDRAPRSQDLHLVRRGEGFALGSVCVFASLASMLFSPTWMPGATR